MQKMWSELTKRSLSGLLRRPTPAETQAALLAGLDAGLLQQLGPFAAAHTLPPGGPGVGQHPDSQNFRPNGQDNALSSASVGSKHGAKSAGHIPMGYCAGDGWLPGGCLQPLPQPRGSRAQLAGTPLE